MGEDRNMPSQASGKKPKKNEVEKSHEVLSESSVSENAAQSSCTWPSCNMSFPNVYERDRHYVTIHSNNAQRPHRCGVVNCPASVTSWARADKLKLHNKVWHGPYHCKYPGCPRGFPSGFASQVELNIHHEDVHSNSPGPGQLSTGGDGSFQESSSRGPTGQSSTSYVSTLSESNANFSSPNAVEYSQYAGFSSLAISSPVQHIQDIPESISETLDPLYKFRDSSEFKFGRVFMLLWSEPLGNSSRTSKVTTTYLGGKVYSEIRRFVIIKPSQGHCLCLPIHTYSRRGVLKPGVKALDHAIIYTGKKPVDFEGEKEMGLTKKPIRVKPNNRGERLDSASRLNYAKVYTVEHNVKVYFIGEIHPSSKAQLIEDYNNTNALLGSQSVPDATNMKEGGPASAKPSDYSGSYASKPQVSQTSIAGLRTVHNGPLTGPSSTLAGPSSMTETYSKPSQDYPKSDTTSRYASNYQASNQEYTTARPATAGPTTSSTGPFYPPSHQNSILRQFSEDEKECSEHEEDLYSAD